MDHHPGTHSLLLLRQRYGRQQLRLRQWLRQQLRLRLQRRLLLIPTGWLGRRGMASPPLVLVSRR